MNPLSLIVEADFEAFVDAIPDAVAIVDERGRIVLANAQIEWSKRWLTASVETLFHPLVLWQAWQPWAKLPWCGSL